MVDRDILHLGSGEDYREDATNVDIDQSVQPDVVHDLSETPWPFADDGYSVIIARHVLEHLNPVPWGEIERVLVPDGKLELTYPIGWTRFQDATHKQHWTVDTAEWLVAPPKHKHEAVMDGELVDITVQWRLWPPNPLRYVYTKVNEAIFGPGAWMGQVTGLYGEVNATYKIYGTE